MIVPPRSILFTSLPIRLRSGQAPGDYRIWSRAYADNADADVMYVGLDGQACLDSGVGWVERRNPSHLSG
jgi:hypothetical protein